jgi:methionine synthase I (cobalamin-dependent)
MSRPAFADFVRDAYQRGRLILMDGPMGTELQQSGLDLEKELAHTWNTSHSDAVSVVHEDYCNAGADVLLTNTFSAHLGVMRGDRNWHGDVERGIELARQGEWDHLYCVGSVGSAVGPDEQAIPAILHVMGALQTCDTILVETQTRLDRVTELFNQIESGRDDGAIMVSFSFSRMPGASECWMVETINGKELHAEDVGVWADQREGQLLALGVNCGQNLRLEDFGKILQGFRRKTDLPLLVRPGITRTIECEFTPKEFAEKAGAFAEAGATLIGGCCGTTPAHIAALRREIDRLGLGWNADD